MVIFEMGYSAGPMDDPGPPPFWLCCTVACVLGGLLAAFDDTSRSHQGSGPLSHLGGCADSAYALLADGALRVEGGGLGLIEPLRELFAKRPDGLLGLDGILASVRSLLSAASCLVTAASTAAAFWLGRSPQKAAAPGGVPSSLSEEKIRMSLWVELSNYIGYIYLFVMGVVREYTIRSWATVSSNPAFKQFVTRERWSTGWVEFYLDHCYTDVKECFMRPICSAPDACMDVVRRVRPAGTLFGPLYKFELTQESQRCVNLSSYNYLGFGGIDNFCTPAARKVALDVGFSPAGTRSEGGTMSVHRELEAEVARFLGKEDALVLGMGFASNSTILPALFEAKAGGKGVLVLSDALNHRSIVEGVRLSGATVRAFAHNDMPNLEEQLRKAVVEGQPGGGKPWRKIFVVVEGIYSMEGDFCRLREIVTLKNRYKAYLYLDEAHSIGAVGATGRGVTELLGVPVDQVDIMMGTFTKSFGSAGGYVAASREVIDALRTNAPGSVYATAMAPPCAAQALAAFRVIAGSEGGTVGAQKLKAIRDNANFFRRRLNEEGFKTLGDVDSPIIPTMIHHPRKMKWFSQQCFEKGIAVVVVGYPAVPILYERVRFCISAAHTEAQLAKVITDMTAIGRRMGILFDNSLGAAERATRQRREEEYAAWLRSAPLERRDEAAVAPAAAAWNPEPLVPAAPAAPSASAAIAATALEAVTKAEAWRTPRDCRLFDPLGYAAKPLPAARRAIEDTMDVYGFGACGPRGFYGTTKPHLELEAEISKFLGTEATIVYSAGAVTASSVLPALVQNGDRVLVDSEVHMGIRAGLRLCKAEVVWLPHGDVPALEAALQKAKAADEAKGKKRRSEKQRPGRTFVVLEGISQRTGRLAPLAEVLELKERFGALLVLDEALSCGALGRHGRGLCEHLGLSPARVDALIGSLEHGVASVGGFCTGRERLVEHQRLAGAGYCYSASSPPCSCTSAVAMLADMAGEAGAERVARLRARAAELHAALREVVATAPEAKLELLSVPESYVQQLRWAGARPEVAAAAAEAAEALLRIARGCADGTDGVRAQVCVPGACGAEGAFDERLGAPPPPMASLRFCASAEQSSEDIAAVASAFRAALRSNKP